MWFLKRNGPGIDDAVLVMGAFPTEGAGFGPDLRDQVMRFLEPLAVEGRVHACRQLLLSAAADETGHQTALGNHIDHRQLFGHADRIVAQRQRIAENDDLRVFGRRRQDRRENIGLRLHAERRVVMLVQHDPIDAQFVGEEVMLEIFVINPAALLRIEILIGEHERGGAKIQAGLGIIGRHRLLGEVHQVHGEVPSRQGGIEAGTAARPRPAHHQRMR